MPLSQGANAARLPFVHLLCPPLCCSNPVSLFLCCLNMLLCITPSASSPLITVAPVLHCSSAVLVSGDVHKLVYDSARNLSCDRFLRAAQKLVRPVQALWCTTALGGGTSSLTLSTWDAASSVLVGSSHPQTHSHCSLSSDIGFAGGPANSQHTICRCCVDVI